MNSLILRTAAIIILYLLAFPGIIEAKRIKTTLRPKIEKSGKTSKSKASADSISRKAEAWKRIKADKEIEISFGNDSAVVFRPESITFAGYDKQATSNRETFHVINSSPLNLQKAEIEITYQDMKGRMLHKRTAIIYCNVPPGETRKTDIKTWDTQNSFYYHLSNPPRRVATPYQVAIRPLTLWIKEEEVTGKR